jgi:L-lactate dehydrogenase complex protein LldE
MRASIRPNSIRCVMPAWIVRLSVVPDALSAGEETIIDVSLFVPCFVDQLMPEVGIAAVHVLERAGCRVRYHEQQTCCGQPPFNMGCHDDARSIARHMLEVFDDDPCVVTPSGSCAAMVKVFFPELFEDTPQEAAARRLSNATHEFSTFLVDVLGVTDLEATFPHRVTLHDGCHGLRELNIQEAPRKLLQNVRGVEVVEMDERALCCGFGGTFAVKFPQISTAMAEVKCQLVIETEAEFIVSNDPSCLMHLQGYLERQGSEIGTLHLAEVLNHG